jgi:hypothetical protein
LKPLAIVAATRKTEDEFKHSTLLWASLGPILGPQVTLHIKYMNAGLRAEGLSTVYNRYLTPEFRGHTVLFVHDDVFIFDFLVQHRLHEALATCDVVGLAGNREPDYAEPSWALRWSPEGKPLPPQQHLSGIVANTNGQSVMVNIFGDTPAQCGLLDGMFLGVNVERALEAGAKFDEQFRYHFYDLDFCRTCTAKGLNLGTWPIAAIHESIGGYNTPDWLATKQLYDAKWNS